MAVLFVELGAEGQLQDMEEMNAFHQCKNPGERSKLFRALTSSFVQRLQSKSRSVDKSVDAGTGSEGRQQEEIKAKSMGRSPPLGTDVKRSARSGSLVRDSGKYASSLHSAAASSICGAYTYQILGPALIAGYFRVSTEALIISLHHFTYSLLSSLFHQECC
jgi:hypothetical protein